MIQALTFTNRFGRSLRCVLAEPELSLFAIKSVSGLGPDRANVNINEYAMADGGYFGSARFSSRTITVNFILHEFDADGNYVPIERTQHVSYEFFQPKMPIRVTVESDELEGELFIDGIVESNEPDIFSSQESIIVAIRCPEYYFKMYSARGTQQTALLYTTSLFEFPFSNESLEEPLIEFGAADAAHILEVNNPGTVEVGCVIDVAFTGKEVGKIYIEREARGRSTANNIGTQTGPDSVPYGWVNKNQVVQKLTINVAEKVVFDDPVKQILWGGFTPNSIQAKLYGRVIESPYVYEKGNKLRFSSIAGNKTASFIPKKGKSTVILDCLPEFAWITLQPGVNRFIVSTDDGFEGKFSVSLTYEPLFSGV